jgi:hypothetical protein
MHTCPHSYYKLLSHSCTTKHQVRHPYFEGRSQQKDERFEFFVALNIKVKVFWIVTSYCLMSRYKYVGGIYCHFMAEDTGLSTTV